MKIEKIGASVTRKVDVGYRPYMEYLESLHGRNPAFGTRENSQTELSLWGTAIIEEGDDVDEVSEKLVDRLDGQVTAFFGNTLAGTPASADDYTYTEVKVKANPEGDPNDW